MPPGLLWAHTVLKKEKTERERKRKKPSLFTIETTRSSQKKRIRKTMPAPSPASAAVSSENVPLFADKHVQFVAGFAKVSQEGGDEGFVQGSERLDRERDRERESATQSPQLNLNPLSLSLLKKKKINFQDRTTFEAVATDHLRLSGVYWGLATLALLGKLEEGGPGLDREEVAAFVSSCAREGAEGVVVSPKSSSSFFSKQNGDDGGKEEEEPARSRPPLSVGYGGAERHDAHLLYTLSAVQVAALIDRMDLIDPDAVMNCEILFFFNFFFQQKNPGFFPPQFFSLFSPSFFIRPFPPPFTPLQQQQTSPPSSSRTALLPGTSGARSTPASPSAPWPPRRY